MRGAGALVSAVGLAVAWWAGAAETVTVGEWRVAATAGALGEVSLAGRPLVRQAIVAGYQPQWKSGRFDLRGAVGRPTADGRGVEWACTVPGQADLRATVTVSGPTAAEWRLAAEVQPEGPCEFGLYLPSATYARPDGSLLVRAGSRPLEIGAERFEPIAVRGQLVFETAATTYTWECSAEPGTFVLQDWRERPESALRLIVVQPVGRTATQLRASVRLTVSAYPAAEVARRRQRLEVRTSWSSPVELANPGFEAGAEGWNLPPNAAVDAELAHSGRQSVRLTVADPARDSVYVTRQVPVVGGSAYRAGAWVRTRAVTARDGRMPSVGAGLIVEWADRDGKWLAAGQYACDLYGDHDWTTRSCADLRAPEAAGYAVVFLAVRGVGMAWFDDVELTRVHRTVVPEAPDPGSELADNTPTLRWRPDARAASYTLEVSRDPAFPADATRRALCTEEVWTATAPLEPGLWYWRVSAPGYEPSVVWQFRQTAAVDLDTTAPAVETTAVRVTAPLAAVTIVVREEGGRPGRVWASVDGGEVACEVGLDQGGGRWPVALRPTGGWTPGLNTVRLAVEDAAANRAEASLWVACQPVPPNPVTIDAAGAYVCAGERAFPLGIYQVSPAAMSRVKAGGFGVVHTYRWESSQDDVAARAYLDSAWANGLRVFVGFDRGIGSGNGLVQGNAEHVARRVAALCDHPGLFCWYLYDEPEVVNQYVSARTLVGYAELIRRLDPHHAVVVTTWGAGMKAYRASWDTHWTQAYQPPKGVVATLREHRRLLDGGSPLTLLVHCYDPAQSARLRAGEAPDPATFRPDAAWLRAAAYAGVTQDINGLFWWWYADGQREFYTVAEVPWAWSALTGVVAELTQMRDVLTAASPAVTQSLDVDGGTVEAWSRTARDRRWVVAVSTSESEVEAAVPAAGDGPAEVCFEGRTVTRAKGVIRDRFGRFGVHVYAFPP